MLQVGSAVIAIGGIRFRSMLLDESTSNFLNLGGCRAPGGQTDRLSVYRVKHFPLVALAVVSEVFLERSRCKRTHIGPRTASRIVPRLTANVSARTDSFGRRVPIGHLPPLTADRSMSAAVSEMFLRRIGRTIVPYGLPAGQRCSGNGSHKMSWPAMAEAV